MANFVFIFFFAKKQDWGNWLYVMVKKFLLCWRSWLPVFWSKNWVSLVQKTCSKEKQPANYEILEMTTVELVVDIETIQITNSCKQRMYAKLHRVVWTVQTFLYAEFCKIVGIVQDFCMWNSTIFVPTSDRKFSLQNCTIFFFINHTEMFIYWILPLYFEVIKKQK